MTPEDAAEFRLTFDPVPGVDYKWVVAYAREQYAAALAVFKELDDKAGSLLAYLGGGAGLLTAAAAAAVADSKIPAAVGLAALPSVLLAAAALVAALRSRRMHAVFLPPDIRHATRYAEFFGDRGEVAFVATVHQCEVLMRPVLAAKARRVEWALRLAVAAVGATALPLVVGVVVRLAG